MKHKTKEKKCSWDSAVEIIKNGGLGVIPTDTIYGIIASAQNEKAVQEIYQKKKRNLSKPLIILISNKKELAKFMIKINSWQEKYLNSVWPGKTSVIVDCPFDQFRYIHRGTNKISFRCPQKEELRYFLQKTGPVVAPSANTEGMPPATNIKEAQEYFGDDIFYINEGEINESPSTIVDITNNYVNVIRPGSVNIKQ